MINSVWIENFNFEHSISLSIVIEQIFKKKNLLTKRNISEPKFFSRISEILKYWKAPEIKNLFFPRIFKKKKLKGINL